MLLKYFLVSWGSIYGFKVSYSHGMYEMSIFQKLKCDILNYIIY